MRRPNPWYLIQATAGVLFFAWFVASGRSWVLGATIVVVAVGVGRLRQRSLDATAKGKHGIAADAPLYAHRTLTLAVPNAQALDFVARAFSEQNIVARSLHVDATHGLVRARTRTTLEWPLLQYSQRLRATVSSNGEASKIELSSRPIVPTPIDGGKNESNVEALGRALWRLAADTSPS